MIRYQFFVIFVASLAATIGCAAAYHGGHGGGFALAAIPFGLIALASLSTLLNTE